MVYKLFLQNVYSYKILLFNFVRTEMPRQMVKKPVTATPSSAGNYNVVRDVRFRSDKTASRNVRDVNPREKYDVNMQLINLLYNVYNSMLF